MTVPSSLVLVVDDDPVSRLVLRHMLERQGAEVIETDGVDTALSAYHPDIDVILCDYVMPDRNGLDLLDELPGDAPPFVLLTGEVREQDLDDPRAGAVDGYLTKPVGTDELAAMLRSVVQARSGVGGAS